MLIHNRHSAQHRANYAEIALICSSNEEILPRRFAALDLDRAAIDRTGAFAGEAFDGQRGEAVLKDRILAVITEDLLDRRR